MHQRFSEELGEAGVGPGMLGAGDRMGRHEMHARRQMRLHLPRPPTPFTEPTSETIAPGFSAGAISPATAPQAPTGTHRMTRSAPRDRLGGGSAV